MNWWKALKFAWTIAQVVKPVKHNEKIDEVIAMVEAAAKEMKKDEVK
jgi:hypothetical protein